MMIFRIVRVIFGLVILSVFFLVYLQDISKWWLLLPAIIYLVILVVGTVSITRRFFLPSRIHGPRSKKWVSLTFDDGPDRLTQSVADCLTRNGVTGTFFVIGHKAEQQPDVLRYLHQQGHLIGNHGFHHRWHFSLQWRKNIVDEILNTSRVIERAIGQQPRFFRPPFGITNPRVANAVRDTEMVPVGWDVRSFDTVLGVSDRLSKRLKRKVRNGSIILLHDTGEGMVGFLDAFIPWLKEQGYDIVSLDRLIDEKPYR